MYQAPSVASTRESVSHVRCNGERCALTLASLTQFPTTTTTSWAGSFLPPQPQLKPNGFESREHDYEPRSATIHLRPRRAESLLSPSLQRMKSAMRIRPQPRGQGVFSRPIFDGSATTHQSTLLREYMQTVNNYGSNPAGRECSSARPRATMPNIHGHLCTR